MLRGISVAFLPPNITAAILEGRQPELTTDALIRMSDLPCAWMFQRQRLGLRRNPEEVKRSAHRVKRSKVQILGGHLGVNILSGGAVRIR
jgi:hypothetical protein